MVTLPSPFGFERQRPGIVMADGELTRLAFGRLFYNPEDEVYADVEFQEFNVHWRGSVRSRPSSERMASSTSRIIAMILRSRLQPTMRMARAIA